MPFTDLLNTTFQNAHLKFKKKTFLNMKGFMRIQIHHSEIVWGLIHSYQQTKPAQLVLTVRMMSLIIIPPDMSTLKKKKGSEYGISPQFAVNFQPGEPDDGTKGWNISFLCVLQVPHNIKQVTWFQATAPHNFGKIPTIQICKGH